MRVRRSLSDVHGSVPDQSRRCQPSETIGSHHHSDEKNLRVELGVGLTVAERLGEDADGAGLHRYLRGPTPLSRNWRGSARASVGKRASMAPVGPCRGRCRRAAPPAARAAPPCLPEHAHAPSRVSLHGAFGRRRSPGSQSRGQSACLGTAWPGGWRREAWRRTGARDAAEASVPRLRVAQRDIQPHQAVAEAPTLKPVPRPHPDPAAAFSIARPLVVPAAVEDKALAAFGLKQTMAAGEVELVPDGAEHPCATTPCAQPTTADSTPTPRSRASPNKWGRGVGWPRTAQDGWVGDEVAEGLARLVTPRSQLDVHVRPAVRPCELLGDA